MPSDTWTGPIEASWFTGADWSDGAPPSSGQTAVITSDAGPLIELNTVAGITIDLEGPSTDTAALVILADANLGSADAPIIVQTPDAGDDGEIDLIGTNTIVGSVLSIGASSNLALQFVDDPSFGTPTLTNEGTLEGTGGGLLYVEDASNNDAVFINNGVILGDGGGVVVGPTMTGTGDIEMANSGTVEVYTTAQNAQFDDGSTNKLILYTPATYTGTVSGLGGGNEIQLVGIEASTGTLVGDTLDLYSSSGGAPIDSIEFSGSYTNDGFKVTGLDGYTFITYNALCYLRGTRVLAATGEIPVEALQIGDRLVTRFGGIRTVKWIGRQSFDWRFVQKNPLMRPVRIRAGALGDQMPARDLLISGGHSVLLGQTLVLAQALVNGVTIIHEPTPENATGVAPIDYYQIDFFEHDCVIAEGIFAESFADGPGLRAQFHNAAEFAALFPEHAPPGELVLCAPRPERGEALAAAIKPVMARAAAGISRGPLEGFIDLVREDLIEGWAMDATHPHLPVELNIFAGDDMIGTILACDERLDLRESGKGDGRCAFSFVPPRRLATCNAANLRVSRVADGATLSFSNAAVQQAA